MFTTLRNANLTILPQNSTRPAFFRPKSPSGPFLLSLFVQIFSGQALFTPLKLRSEGLVPASAAQSADADFHSHLPRRRDSLPSSPLRVPEAKETLQGPRTPAHRAPAQYEPARPAMASSGSCAASG